MKCFFCEEESDTGTDVCTKCAEERGDSICDILECFIEKVKEEKSDDKKE